MVPHPPCLASLDGRSIEGEGLAVIDVTTSNIATNTHQHRCAYIYVPVSGAVLEGGADERQWSPERIEFRPPGHRHAIRIDAPSRILVIALEPWRREQLAAFFREPDAPASVPSAFLCGITHALAEAMERADHASPILVPALALQLIAHAAAIESNGSRRPSTVDRALCYMREHVAEPLSKGGIARDLCISPRTLAEAFRSSTGETLMASLLRMRTELALHLIATTDGSLKEIAAQAGFYDQAHMNRQVRRSTGRTPMEIRRSLRHSALPAPAARAARPRPSPRIRRERQHHDDDDEPVGIVGGTLPP